jgi:hypothetical protein
MDIGNLQGMAQAAGKWLMARTSDDWQLLVAVLIYLRLWRLHSLMKRFSR